MQISSYNTVYQNKAKHVNFKSIYVFRHLTYESTQKAVAEKDFHRIGLRFIDALENSLKNKETFYREKPSTERDLRILRIVFSRIDENLHPKKDRQFALLAGDSRMQTGDLYFLTGDDAVKLNVSRRRFKSGSQTKNQNLLDLATQGFDDIHFKIRNTVQAPLDLIVRSFTESRSLIPVKISGENHEAFAAFVSKKLAEKGQ